MKQNIKEKVLKDMFPDKHFVFLRKDGVDYISNDAVDILLKHEKDETIAEIKRNKPKGFCYICGSGKSVTIHHLKDFLKRKKAKDNGMIPFCRKCHDVVEEIKTNGMKTYHLGYNEGKKKKLAEVGKVIDEWFMDLSISPLGKDMDKLKEELFGKENV